MLALEHAMHHCHSSRSFGYLAEVSRHEVVAAADDAERDRQAFEEKRSKYVSLRRYHMSVGHFLRPQW